MNTIREIQKINEVELERGMAGTAASWHTKYAESAWVYVGNLDHDLTEGDVICVMSQYGEIEDIHLVRDNDTGKSKGFAFLKYEDARSCILAVDNLIGSKVCGRPLRIDHVERYRLPKHVIEQEEEKERRLQPGHAYLGQEIANEYNIQQGQDLFARPQSQPPPPQERSNLLLSSEEQILGINKSDDDDDRREAKRRRKKERERKHRHRSDDDDDDDKDYDDDRRESKKRRKKRKHGDDDYDKDDVNEKESKRRHKEKRRKETKRRYKDDNEDDDDINRDDDRREHRPLKDDRRSEDDRRDAKRKRKHDERKSDRPPKEERHRRERDD